MSDYDYLESTRYNKVTVLEATPMANGAVGVLLVTVPAEFAASHSAVVRFAIYSQSDAEASSVGPQTLL